MTVDYDGSPKSPRNIERLKGRKGKKCNGTKEEWSNRCEFDLEKVLKKYSKISRIGISVS